MAVNLLLSSLEEVSTERDLEQLMYTFTINLCGKGMESVVFLKFLSILVVKQI